ncbi:MAG: hypothetical protein WKF55_08765 [Gemmatimonadaceae bacterium]
MARTTARSFPYHSQSCGYALLSVKRIESLGEQDDPGKQRNLLTDLAVRIPLAIPVFVDRTNRLGGGSGDVSVSGALITHAG